MKRKPFECVLACLAVAMSLTLESCSKRKDIPISEREITIDHPYLNLPVKTGKLKRRVSLTVDGDKIHDFDIELTGDDPDFWVFIDVSGLLGKKVLLQADQPRESDPAVLDRITQDDRIRDSDDLYKERYRPQFHFTSRRGWNNDPNGLVYHNGEYHLFYQHNPYGWDWGNMHWGHAVSTDLKTWTQLSGLQIPGASECPEIFELPVGDLEGSIGFYEKLGFRNVMGRKFDDGNGLIKVAMMEREGVVMELYQLPPDQLSKDIRTRKDGHLDHIAFNVKDIDTAFEEVKRAGLVAVQDQPVKLDFWERGCRYFSIRGPDGEILEFNQIL